MGTSYNRHVLEKAWELFSSGETQELEKISPTIRDSWLRSKSLGVDPGLKRIPQMVPPEAIEDFLSNSDIVAAGQKVIHSMANVLEDPWCGVGLCDSAGRTLASVIGHRLEDLAAEWNGGVPGSGMGEQNIGTDHGTAIYIKRPLQIRPGEHYCWNWKDWTTNVIPLHDPLTKRIVGTLSIEWPGDRAHSKVFDMLRWGRQTLESELYTRELSDRFHVLEQYNAYDLKFPNDAILAVDRQGYIFAASRPTTKLLRLPPDAFLGASLAQVLGLNIQELSRRKLSEVVLSSPQHPSVSVVASAVSQQGREVGQLLVLRSQSKGTSGKYLSKSWQSRYTFNDLIGKNLLFRQALALARTVAPTDLCALLTGESGSGKELLAHAIHAASWRSSGPFVPFNCGSIPEELMEAELFGYGEGAFTGAIRGGQVGKLEVAHEGTLFLDEVDAMPAKMQVSLLRVLEDGVVVPVGSNQPRLIDVRIIAATNKDLRQKVSQGSFRADLYYRLSGFVLSLPPLRERTDDIPVLADHFLKGIGPLVRVTPEAIAVLQSYAWPGNARELKNVLLRAAALARSPTITPHDLPPELVTNSERKESPVGARLDPFAQAEKACIAEALTKAQGDLSEVATSLGIHRVTLYRKMRRHGISTSFRSNK